MNSFLKSLIIIAILLMTCSCATVRLANQGNVKTPLEMKSYRINIADEKTWQDWASSTTPVNDTLTLQKLKIWPLSGEIQGTTTIKVMRDLLISQESHLSETEYADNIRNIEEKVMREKGPQEGGYEIEDLSNSELSLNGKKLYSMLWKATKGSAAGANFKRSFFVKCAMYLYFPENFKDSHTLYGFLITDAYIPGSLISVNVEQIYPIIDGFEIK